MQEIKMIQPWQRSHIFGAARDLGMSTKSDDKSDDLHLLIGSRTEKDSLTKLTYDEANGLIDELKHRRRFGSTQAPRKHFKFEHRPGGISESQYRKTISLMCELRKLDETRSTATIEQRVAGVINKCLPITASPEDPYIWLTYHQGRKLIIIIDGMLEAARRKDNARGDTG